MRMLLFRLSGLWRRRALDTRLDDEMGTHLDLLAAEYERRGMTREEERR